jgi:fermentation-respiration switch protein FrsA (DUF1100 family)
MLDRDAQSAGKAAMMAKTLLGALTLYAIVVLLAWLGQRRLMYFPNPQRISPAAAGLMDVTEAVLDTPDGARLVVWRAAPSAGRPTLVYFHGNAGNLINRAPRFARYRDLGFGLFAVNSRGYGGSSGAPSEARNRADALRAYETLIGEGVTATDIVLYGESLGSALAVALAAERPVGAVILDAPFTSVVTIAAQRYWMLPVRALLTDRYESNRIIGAVRAPLLILHGERDSVVPSALGRKLFELANEPKRLLVYPDGHHSDLDDHGAVSDVSRWLEDVRARR